MVALRSFICQIPRVEDRVVTLERDVKALLGEDRRGEFGSSVSFTLVTSVRSENRNDGRLIAIDLAEQVRDEIGFVGVVEGSNVEFELVRSAHEIGEVCGSVTTSYLISSDSPSVW